SDTACTESQVSRETVRPASNRLDSIGEDNSLSGRKPSRPQVCSPEHNMSGNARPLQFLSIGLLGQGARASVDKIKLGKPGGAVYARKTAIKPDATQDLRREVGILKSLRHPHIAKIIETPYLSDEYSLVMDVASCDLKQLMRLPPEDIRLTRANL